MNDILYVLKIISHYNGYDDLFRKWANIKLATGENMLFKPDLNCKDWDDREAAQIEIIWMMLVIMFGDWGTSPRYGWIKDIKAFRKFLNHLTDGLKILNRITEDQHDNG